MGIGAPGLVEEGLGWSWVGLWMALDLVNPAPKEYLHLWAKAKAMQWAWASGEGI